MQKYKIRGAKKPQSPSRRKGLPASTCNVLEARQSRMAAAQRLALARVFQEPSPAPFTPPAAHKRCGIGRSANWHGGRLHDPAIMRTHLHILRAQRVALLEHIDPPLGLRERGRSSGGVPAPGRAHRLWRVAARVSCPGRSQASLPLGVAPFTNIPARCARSKAVAEEHAATQQIGRSSPPPRPSPSSRSPEPAS